MVLCEFSCSVGLVRRLLSFLSQTQGAGLRRGRIPTVADPAIMAFCCDFDRLQ